MLALALTAVAGGRLCAADTLPEATQAGALPGNISAAGVALRYLIVVEDSVHMKRGRETAADGVSRLLLGGFNEKIEPGQWIGMWRLSETLETDFFAPLNWNPEGRLDAGNQAYKVVQKLRSKAKKLDVPTLMLSLAAEATTTPRLTVYFVTAGAAPIVGTPFDDRINAIFGQHGERMRKAGKPFVLVLLAESGQWVAHAVTPADRPIYVPPFPAPVRSTNPSSPAQIAPAGPASARPPQPLILIGTNRAPSLSPEAIRDALRQPNPTNAP
jgi:hypothetical protein